MHDDLIFFWSEQLGSAVLPALGQVCITAIAKCLFLTAI